MKKIILIICSIFIVQYSLLNAQKKGQARIDSLMQELPKAKEDTNKVNLLNSLSLENIISEECIKYSEQALQLAEKLSWKKGIADAFRTLGLNYEFISNYPKALEYCFKSLKIREELPNKSDIIYVNIDIGTIYEFLEDYTKALEYYSKALKMSEEINDKISIINCMYYFGHLYSSQKDFTKSLEYYLKALKINEELGHKADIAKCYSYISNTYSSQKKYPVALEYLFKALKIGEELSHKSGIVYIQMRIGNIYSESADYPKAFEYYEKSLKIVEELEDKLWLGQIFKDFGELFLKFVKNNPKYILYNKYFFNSNKKNLIRAMDYLNKSIIIFKEYEKLDELLEIYSDLYEVYQLYGDFKSALQSYKKHIEIRDSIYGTENKKRINSIETKRDIELKEKEQAIKNLESKNQQITRYFVLASFASLIFILGYVLYARRKSEKLLLNVLPEQIATRLKQGETPIADHFEEASVIFIDIADFTKLSARSKPQEMVKMLNDIFTIFDKISAKYGLEKIKTIGDCYMAAAGIPIPRIDHAEAVAMFALEAMETMKGYRVFGLGDGEIGNEELSPISLTPNSKSYTQNPIPYTQTIQFRIGLDCGPIVAGVIGEQKFIYDLWGDMVNTASRMETHGVIGKIQCTERFKAALSHPMTASHRMTFEERGEIEIKGKGMMRTYFLVNNKK